MDSLVSVGTCLLGGPWAVPDGDYRSDADLMIKDIVTLYTL